MSVKVKIKSSVVGRRKARLLKLQRMTLLVLTCGALILLAPLRSFTIGGPVAVLAAFVLFILPGAVVTGLLLGR